MDALNENERAQQDAFIRRLESMAVHHLTETTVAASGERHDHDLSRHPAPEELTPHEREALVGKEHFSTVFDHSLLHRFEDLCHALQSSSVAAQQTADTAFGTMLDVYAEHDTDADHDARSDFFEPKSRAASTPQLPEIPDIQRNYLVDFLREPVPALGERPCSLGLHCESVALARAKYHQYGSTGENSAHGFVLREFLLPEQIVRVYRAMEQGQSVQEAYEQIPPQTCLLCTRICTQSLAIAQGACFDHQPDLSQQQPQPQPQPQQSPKRTTLSDTSSASSVLQANQALLVQTHGNLFDCEGEYRSDTAMLQAGPHAQGLIKPIVRYHRAHYVRSTASVIVGPQEKCRVRSWAEHSSIICSAQHEQQKEDYRAAPSFR